MVDQAGNEAQGTSRKRARRKESGSQTEDNESTEGCASFEKERAIKLESHSRTINKTRWLVITGSLDKEIYPFSVVPALQLTWFYTNES